MGPLCDYCLRRVARTPDGTRHRRPRRRIRARPAGAIRAIVLLEQIGTPDTLAILRDMPPATPTRSRRRSRKAIEKMESGQK